MVLDLRLTGLAGLLAACSAGEATAPAPANQTQAAAPAARLDAARVGGRDLALVTDGGQCALDLGGTRHPLGFAAPCRFLRLGVGRPPNSHDYGDRGIVILVGGPPAADADYAVDVGRTPADRCSNTGRAVIVANGKVALGDIDTSPVWACPDSAPDEKFYYGIAHERPFAKRKTLN